MIDDEGNDDLWEFVADIWNPKAKAVGHVRMDMQDAESGEYRVEVHVGGERVATAHVYWNDSTPIHFLEIESQPGVHPAWRGQGWGLVLYLGGAMAAASLGYNGVASYFTQRSDDSNLLWKRLHEHGLAKSHLDRPAQGGGNVYDILLAKTVVATGLLR